MKLYVKKNIVEKKGKKPNLIVCPNHCNAVSEAKSRYWDSSKKGQAISDGRGWYKSGG